MGRTRSARHPLYRATARVVAFNENANGGFHMPSDLEQLRPHIDHMRTTLSQTAETERALVQSLSDALKRINQGDSTKRA